ncbi:MAG: hypothetical protein E7001_00105 [Coriobacteriaceae bacterium]|nr:hypothetical protein [Coriobacteriaceae bacterium]
MSGTIRIEPGKLQVAKQCLQSEAESINALAACVAAAQEAFTGSWEGEAASATDGVFMRALSATQLVYDEAGAYCAAVQSGVDGFLEIDRQRARDMREKQRGPREAGPGLYGRR